MSWSFKIGRVFGIGLYVHFTFLLLLAFLGFAAHAVTGSMQAALLHMGFILVLFGIVVLHELGHAMAAKCFGIKTKDITLLPIGGLARLERMPREPIREFVIAIAGPAVNVVLALAALLAILTTYGTLPWAMEGFLGGNLLNSLFWVNVILVVFNMIPAFPMDGGRVLRAVLAMMMSHASATRIAARVGQMLAVFFGIVGFFGIPGVMGSNPILMLIALFVFLGAGQEAAMVSVMEHLSGASVRRAMMTRFETLSPRDPIGWALQQTMTGAQKDFPVMEEDRLVGMLTRAELREALQADGLAGQVGDVMRPIGATLNPDEPLEHALDRFQEGQKSVIPVMEDDELVGLMTIENLQEFMAMRQLLAERGPRRPAAWYGGRQHDGEVFSRN